MPNQYTLGLVSKKAPIERFWPKVQIQANGCWLWTGCLARPQGYARININRKAEYAHIFIYELFWGSIPKDKEVDHLCRNRACVNPFHLEVVSSLENTLRGETSAGITARSGCCMRGHPWTDENTYYRPKGHRMCRACHREREYRRKHSLSKMKEICYGQN